VIILVLLVGQSCSNDNLDSDCKVIGAKSGYFDVPNGTLTYDLEYRYLYEEDMLTEIEQVLIGTGELLSTTHFNYDGNGRLVSEFKTESSSFKYHTYYDYASTMLNTTVFSISGGDTLNIWEDHELYLKNPENSVYHTADYAYKFNDGNVFEYGSYSVSGTDTTDTFYQRYFYDKNANYYNHLEYRAVIPKDYKWAKVTSNNNVVRAIDIGGGWDVSYTFQYDKKERLTRYTGPSSIAIDFEYKCN
jgi:hypothetical protein